MAIKIFIIEDHTEFRESLLFILQPAKGIECLGVFSTVESALQCKNPPDVILLDISLPGMNGIDGIPKLKESFPRTSVIMLTIYDDNDSIFRSIVAGADGYLLKTTEPKKLISAIEEVFSGGYPVTPSVARQAINYYRRTLPKVPVKNDLLTDREKEILKLIIDGCNNLEIASKLFISIQTVRNHIRHIYEKLQVHSKSQAVVKALKENLL